MFDIDQENMEVLLGESVAEICRHENFSLFLKWMQARMGVRRLSLFTPGNHTDITRMATLLAVAIWNIVPLPGKGFQINKMSLPAPNERCLCGSGKKVRDCCDIGKIPFEPMDTDIVWPLVFDNVPAAMLRDAVKKNQIPFLGRIQGAITSLEQEKPKKALFFLEALFFDDFFQEIHDDGAFALSLLLDAYDLLGFIHKKIQLIEHVIATAPASPLRSEAYQRLATIQMDQGRAEEAWQSFRKAQVDTPDNFMIGLLEVQLLLAEHRFDRARARAHFLSKRMEKQGMDEEFALKFLKEVAADPRKGSLRMEFAAVQDIGLEFVDWLQEVERRPLPAYLSFELGNGAGFGDAPEDILSEILPGDYAIAPPELLWKCGENWEDVSPVEKWDLDGSSFHEFPWRLDADFDWIRFLRSHPECFDILSVLEDILLLLDLHPNGKLPGFAEYVQAPVMKRALAIIDQIISSLPPDAHLPMLAVSNHPLHRILYNHGLEVLQNNELEAFASVAERLLKINPHDDFRVRTSLVNCYLTSRAYRQALAVCSRYPDDILVEIVFGRVLALYCLGEKDDACRAAEDAVKRLPLAAEYLVTGRVKAPKMFQGEQPSGGPAEAYLYRVGMRSVWKDSGTALPWLKGYVAQPR